MGGKGWEGRDTLPELTTSSKTSLIAAMKSTKDRGTMVVYRPVGEAPGTCWSWTVGDGVGGRAWWKERKGSRKGDERRVEAER